MDDETRKMLDESINFLRLFEPPEGYRGAFSGGKDSIVLKECTRLAGVRVTWIYSCTRIDPPEVVRFIREQHPDVTFAYPKITFYEGIKKKMAPMKKRRWCCDHLKKYPTKNHPLREVIVGIRAEESASRSSRSRIESFGVRNPEWVFKPIFDWKTWHVWDFIQNLNLPYPALYDEGMERLGCVICPFIMRNNQRQLYEHMRRWPGYYKAFEKSLHYWFTTTARGEKKAKLKTFDDYLAACYCGFESPPKTERGAKPFIRCLQDALGEEKTP